MRELDVLLLRHLELRYDAAPADEKQAFESLLALSDPELVEYLLKQREPEAGALGNVVRQILGNDSS